MGHRDINRWWQTFALVYRMMELYQSLPLSRKISKESLKPKTKKESPYTKIFWILVPTEMWFSIPLNTSKISSGIAMPTSYKRLVTSRISLIRSSKTSQKKANQRKARDTASTTSTTSIKGTDQLTFNTKL